MKHLPPRSSRIRTEAARLFAEKGYAATSMRDLADAVGLLPGSLYSHISSKEELLLEIVEDAISRFTGALDPILASDSTATEKLRSAIRAHLQLVAESLDYTSVVFHQWKFLTSDNRERVVSKRHTYEHQFLEIVRTGVSNGEFRSDIDSRVAVLVVLGALNWAPEWYSPTVSRGDVDVAEVIGEMLVSSLLPR